MGSNVQDEEGETLEMADAQMISSALNTTLTRQAIENVFGERVKPLAYIQVIVPKKRDWQRDLAIDTALVGYGVQLSVSDALERYGRSAPKPGEPVLTAPVQPALLSSDMPPAAGSGKQPPSAANEALADVAVDQHPFDPVAGPVHERYSRLGVFDGSQAQAPRAVRQHGYLRPC